MITHLCYRVHSLACRWVYTCRGMFWSKRKSCTPYRSMFKVSDWVLTLIKMSKQHVYLSKYLRHFLSMMHSCLCSYTHSLQRTETNTNIRECSIVLVVYMNTTLIWNICYTKIRVKSWYICTSPRAHQTYQANAWVPVTTNM